MSELINPYGVRVGQVWKDWDTRHRDENPGRLLKVMEISGPKAVCSELTSGRTTWISLKRFKPTSTGYKLVSGGSIT